MSDEIINVLNYICDKIGIVIDWTADNVYPQVMDILSRYRILMLINNAVCIVFAIIASIVLLCLWKKAIKARETASKEQTSNFWWHYYRNGSVDINGVFGLIIASIFIGFIILLLFGLGFSSFFRWLLVPEIKYLEVLKTYIQ